MWKHLGLALAFAALASGCGNPPAGDDDDDFTNVPCDEDTRDDEYVAGLEKIGLSNMLKATLDDASPAPPDVGNNVWTLTVVDNGNDTPLDGCTFDVTPWMPDHNHGTSPAPIAAPAGGAGEYEVSQLNLFMGGLWEVTLEATCTGMTDTLVYTFCLEG